MKDFMSIAHSMSDTFCGHEWYEQCSMSDHEIAHEWLVFYMCIKAISDSV